MLCLCPTTIKTRAANEKKRKIITQYGWDTRRDTQQLIFFWLFRIHKKTRLPYSSSSLRPTSEKEATNTLTCLTISTLFSSILFCAGCSPTHHDTSWGIFPRAVFSCRRTERSRFRLLCVLFRPSLHTKYIPSPTPPSKKTSLSRSLLLLLLPRFVLSNQPSQPTYNFGECNILCRNARSGWCGVVQRRANGWIHTIQG